MFEEDVYSEHVYSKEITFASTKTHFATTLFTHLKTKNLL